MYNELVIPSIENSSIRILNPQKAAQKELICDWHLHNELEISYLLQGRKIFYANDTTYELSAGDIILINRRVPHKTITPVGSQGILLQFKTDLNDNNADFEKYLSYFMDREQNKAVLFQTGSPVNLQLSQSISKINTELLGRGLAHDIFIKAYVYEVLACLYRHKILTAPDSFSNTGHLTRLIPVLDHIHEHYAETITLEEMSGLLNVDKAHLCRLFKSTVKTSLMNYVNFVRIYHAEVLLRTTEKNISEISYETGFCSVSYFIETFRKFNFCTPAKYRKLVIGNRES